MNLQEHLEKRQFNLSVHHAWINEEEYIATFPLWNLSGQLVGYQQYRPDAEKRKTILMMQDISLDLKKIKSEYGD